MTQACKRFSFSRASRLGGRHAFAAVFAFKCSAAGDYFQVYARPNAQGAARLGVTVNKRFVPHAVARNFCKRLARETFRVNCSEFAGLDLVVRARQLVPRAASDQARAEILALMQHVKRLSLRNKEFSSGR